MGMAPERDGQARRPRGVVEDAPGPYWARRRLYPAEALWFAVVDQACADSGSPNPRVRADAAVWWDSDMPALFARVLDIPLSRLLYMRTARGGLRQTADGGNMGRRLGVHVVQKDGYHYERTRRRPRPAA